MVRNTFLSGEQGILRGTIKIILYNSSIKESSSELKSVFRGSSKKTSLRSFLYQKLSIKDRTLFPRLSARPNKNNHNFWKIKNRTARDYFFKNFKPRKQCSP